MCEIPRRRLALTLQALETRLQELKIASKGFLGKVKSVIAINKIKKQIFEIKSEIFDWITKVYQRFVSNKKL